MTSRILALFFRVFLALIVVDAVMVGYLFVCRVMMGTEPWR